jgi:anti-anti-sigma regulatory factor
MESGELRRYRISAQPDVPVQIDGLVLQSDGEETPLVDGQKGLRHPMLGPVTDPAHAGSRLTLPAAQFRVVPPADEPQVVPRRKSPMPSPGKILCARHGENVFIRIEGRGTHVLGADLDPFLADLCARGDFAGIVVDLTAAEALDSTMLGLLARIAKWMRRERKCNATLLCADDRIASAVRGVGLDRLVTLTGSSTPAATALGEIPTASTDQTDRARMVLAAHRELMELNAENVSKFRGVVEFLERDLG